MSENLFTIHMMLLFLTVQTVILTYYLWEVREAVKLYLIRPSFKGRRK